MRVLMLTQFFNPELSLVMPLAQGLRRLGHEIQVLTGFPNYPSGKVYPGYKIRPWMRETIDGFPVLRVALYPSHDRSAVRRIANYLSFASSAATIGVALSSPVDVVYVYHPPATLGLPALFFHWLRKFPFVYHVQDLWPDTLATTEMFANRTGLKIVDAYCRFVYKRASHIVVISPGFKRVLIDRGVPQGKIQVIYNWCHDNEIQSVAPDNALARELGMEGRFNIVFAGNVGKAQALDSILSAAPILRSRFPKIQFIILGSGIEAPRLQQRVHDENLAIGGVWTISATSICPTRRCRVNTSYARACRPIASSRLAVRCTKCCIITCPRLMRPTYWRA